MGHALTLSKIVELEQWNWNTGTDRQTESPLIGPKHPYEFKSRKSERNPVLGKLTNWEKMFRS